MSIKNKDGSTFKLKKPNPVMKQQDLWDDGSKFELHNFTQEDVILHNFEEPEKPKEVKKELPKPVFQSLEEIIPQEVKVPIKDIRKPKKSASLFYCMPATTINNYDPLYDENKVSLTYGQQFTFEAIIVESNDLMIKIWSRKEIEKSSIIYQPSNRRWWRIEEAFIADGFTMVCVPSSIQPSFRLQS